MAIKASAQVSITDVSDGAEGKGIASVIPEYYLSSSKTTQADGSWSTTPPTWASGKYLWVRQIVTYTDSSVSRTQPYCDTSWEAVNDVQIGGRNLALNTSKMFNGIYSGCIGNVSNTIIMADASVPSGYAVSYTIKGTSTDNIGPYFNYTKIIGDLSKLIKGETYTISFWAKASEDTSFIYPSSLSEGQTIVNVSQATITTSWQKYFVTFKFTNTNKMTSCFYIPQSYSWVILYLSSYKLEKGNKATDWSPAPEDVETSINTAQSTADTAKANAATAQSTADTAKKNAATAQTAANNAQSTADTARSEAADAAKTATNYLHYDSNGLTVSGETFATGGNPSGKNIRINSNGVNIRNGGTVLASYGESTTIGSTSGRHILIDSDSVDIKNGNTILSQFTDSTIYLGKNSTTSTIDFCNGNGYILGRDDSTYGKGLWVDGGDRMYIVSNKELFITASSGGSDNDPRIRMIYSGSNSTLNIISPKITISGDTVFSGDTVISGTVKNTLTASGKYASPGSYYNNGALLIRENNLNANTSGDFGYAPRIGFDWYGFTGGSFSLNYDGTFYLRKQDGNTRATLDANIQGNATNSDTVDGMHASDIFAHKGLALCAQVGPNTRGCFNVNLTDTSMGWINVIQFEQGHFLSQLGLPCWLDGSAKDLYIRSKYVGGGTAYDFADWNTGWKKLGIDVVIGTSATTLSYRSEFTRAVVEFWKTTVSSSTSTKSTTVYDSAVLNGLSSSMGAQTPTTISSGPDFAFAIGNSSSGQIIISGNFTKFKVTYFN